MAVIRTDADRAAWIDRQMAKEDLDRRAKEIRAQLEGYPSAEAADLGHLWESEYDRKRGAVAYAMSQREPLFFGRRRWRARRDRLIAQLRDEYEQIRAAIVAGQLDKVAAIRDEFLAKEVYVLLRDEGL